MSSAKIQIALGNLSFSGEGSEKWLAQQLEKILKIAPALGQYQSSDEAHKGDKSVEQSAGKSKSEPVGTLASYLKSKNAESSQNRRFLVTADWLHRKGHQEITTTAVSKALREQHQARLGNPAECLNQNVRKGFCEKIPGSKNFFITPDGQKELNKGT